MKIGLILPLLVLIGCGVTTKNSIVSPEGKVKLIKNPPWTVRVARNFYVDRIEESNYFYRDILREIEKRYGKDNDYYRSMIPDTTVWSKTPLVDGNEKFVEGFRNLSEVYFNLKDLRFFPVVGVSFEQAKEYCRFRSELVFEYYLVYLGKIPNYLNRNSDEVFTIQKYFEGNFLGIKPDKDMPYPDFRLPTEAEWEQIAKGKFDNNDPELGLKLRKKSKNIPFNTYEYAHRPKRDTNLLNITMHYAAFDPNDFGIYNLIGNVAEMTSSKGIAKGGSWMHKISESRIAAHQVYSEPTSWLGFRCVCRWKFYEE